MSANVNRMSHRAVARDRAAARARRARVGAELAALIDVPSPGSWALEGACRQHDPDLHFPTADEGSEAFARQVEQARAVCAWCPVRAQCAAHAIAVGEPHGVWGGLTPTERRAARRATTHAEGA